jgi:hypothetical protein
MNNWCIGWLFMHILTGILIFKGLTARRLYKSFGVKRLMYLLLETDYMKKIVEILNLQRGLLKLSVYIVRTFDLLLRQVN